MPKKVFLDIDYSNIEGRINAWLAGEEWKLEAFRAQDRGQGRDLYVVNYARSFGIPIEEVTPKQRQTGKTSELLCQFQGGVGALVHAASVGSFKIKDLVKPIHEAVGEDYWAKMLGKYPAALDKRGLPAPQWAACKTVITKWRQANPKVTASWPMLQNAAIEAIDSPCRAVTLKDYQGVTFYREKSILFIKLPSGRNLHYWNPRIREKRTNVLKFPDGTIEPEDQFASPLAIDALIACGMCERIQKFPQRIIHFDGKCDRSSYMDNRTGQLLRLKDAVASGFEEVRDYASRIGAVRIDGWGEKTLYGGLIGENIVQAAEHDIHREGMLAAARSPHAFEIDLHTHDSITPEVLSEHAGHLKERLAAIVGAAVQWAPGLPIGVKVHAGERYS
jgi:hypothetical protein